MSSTRRLPVADALDRVGRQAARLCLDLQARGFTPDANGTLLDCLWQARQDGWLVSARSDDDLLKVAAKAANQAVRDARLADRVRGS